MRITSGKWTVRANPGPNVVSEHGEAPFTIESNGLLIARLGQQPNSEANALAMAAVPEMIYALRELLAEWHKAGDDETGGILAARDALAKADYPLQRILGH